MKKFVELIQRIHQERFSVVMNKIITEKIPIAFLTIIPNTNSVEIVKELRNQGLNIQKLIVNTPPLTVAEDLEFKIVGLNDVDKIQPKFEYILVINNLDARVAIKRMPKCKVLSIDRSSNDVPFTSTEYIYGMFMNHLTELQEVYESLIDEESKRTFRGYWLGNISNQLGEIVHTNNAHYLIDGFIPKDGAITFDAGLFDGGTATVFAQMGYKVYGFEMDKRNFEFAKLLAEKNNFVAENMSLGSFKHKMRYNPFGGSANSLNVNGTEITEVTTIDSYVREHRLPSVDFIKLDVEGAELDILRGARTSIARFKPILAISAYHKWDDFWVLTNFIKSIRHDYEFALRQGAENNEEEPMNFSIEAGEYYSSLGLEPEVRQYWECVLFAR